MQIGSESTHTLTLSGVEASALITAVTAALAIPGLLGGSDPRDLERKRCESFLSVTSNHVPGARRTQELAQRTVESLGLNEPR